MFRVKQRMQRVAYFYNARKFLERARENLFSKRFSRKTVQIQKVFPQEKNSRIKARQKQNNILYEYDMERLGQFWADQHSGQIVGGHREKGYSVPVVA
jgi:hypothetical protein